MLLLKGEKREKRNRKTRGRTKYMARQRNTLEKARGKTEKLPQENHHRTPNINIKRESTGKIAQEKAKE